jgi:hypothetical protein
VATHVYLSEKDALNSEKQTWSCVFVGSSEEPNTIQIIFIVTGIMCIEVEDRYDMWVDAFGESRNLGRVW